MQLIPTILISYLLLSRDLAPSLEDHQSSCQDQVKLVTFFIARACAYKDVVIDKRTEAVKLLLCNLLWLGAGREKQRDVHSTFYLVTENIFTVTRKLDESRCARLITEIGHK